LFLDPFTLKFFWHPASKHPVGEASLSDLLSGNRDVGSPKFIITHIFSFVKIFSKYIIKNL